MKAEIVKGCLVLTGLDVSEVALLAALQRWGVKDVRWAGGGGQRTQLEIEPKGLLGPRPTR